MDVARNLCLPFRVDRASSGAEFLLVLGVRIPCLSLKALATCHAAVHHHKEGGNPYLVMGSEDEHRGYIHRIWEDIGVDRESVRDHASRQPRVAACESAVVVGHGCLLVGSFQMAVHRAVDTDDLYPEI